MFEMPMNIGCSANLRRAAVSRIEVIIIALTLILSAAVFAPQVFAAEATYVRATEPMYNGRRLSEWLADVELWSSRWPAPLTEQAKTAVTHIGTNAIPFLLKFMEGASSGFVAGGSIEAFRVLGPSARSAIPELARLATNQPESVLRAQAQDQLPVLAFGSGPLAALGSIGPEALPALISILTNGIAPGTRLGAIQAIRVMGSNAAPAIPSLLRYVSDENDMVAMEAVSALGTAGPGNLQALAVLEKIAQGPKRNLRASALEALSHFCPESIPVLVRALGDTNIGTASIAFHMLAFSAPAATTNDQVVALAAAALQSTDTDRREWAAFALRAIGQQAEGLTPDLMMPIGRMNMRFADATNVLLRLAPELLAKEPLR